MSSSSNVALTRLPWGRLPRSPVTPSPLEISFRDIMAEQQRESGQDKDFEKYVQNSYVTVADSGERKPDTPNNLSLMNMEDGIGKEDIPDVEKSFMELEDLDTDLKMVMSFYEDQDFDDAAYELSQQELDDLPDDDTSKYYEGLAKKLSTVVEIQSSPLSSINNVRGSRTSSSSLLQQTDLDSFDSQTKAMLTKLKQKGVLRGELSASAHKIVHLGECATILHGTGGMLKRRDDAALAPAAALNTSMLKLKLPKECAIKVFRNDPDNLETLMDCELEEEERQVAAKREMAHLNRMTRAGIPCPQVQFLYGHILVTDFLGKDGVPAKRLRDANELKNNKSSLRMAYEQITNNMKTLFKTCQLVHGGLTPKTILWYKRQAYFTSVGGAVNSNRPSALELLYRDCLTITEFFERKGKPGCKTPQQLFHWITGVDYTGQLLQETCGGDFAIV